MNAQIQLSKKAHLFHVIMASFFMFLFGSLQLAVLNHHHEGDLSTEHSVEQHCEICLYVVSKHHHFLKPDEVKIPTASVLELADCRLHVIIKDVIQVQPRHVNRGPPVLIAGAILVPCYFNWSIPTV